MKTLLFIVSIFVGFTLTAQTTYNLNWQRNFTSPASDLTVNVGDTVIWTWTDAFPHTVETSAGSTETFASSTLSGLGQTYSHTFTSVGSNPYFCGIHDPGSMSGTITVQVLATAETVVESDVYIYPNPTNDLLQISGLKNTIKWVKMYDIVGRKIKSITGSEIQKNSKIDVSKLETGTYFIEIQTENGIIKKQFIKK